MAGFAEGIESAGELRHVDEEDEEEAEVEGENPEHGSMVLITGDRLCRDFKSTSYYTMYFNT